MSYNLYNSDCLLGLKNVIDNSVDMILTSPPYDNLRAYRGYNFDFENIALELSRVLKDGGALVWVVNDSVKNGSESLSSFKQALYFVEVCGLNLSDTMIYRKLNYMPQNKNRYEQEYEYMFLFTKGKLATFNPIRIPCKYAGVSGWGNSSYYKSDSGELKGHKKVVIGDDKIKGNIFEYRVGSTERKKRKGVSKVKHPAVFPLDLARDMISSFSNIGDLILDPFSGSGTSCLASLELDRNFLGFEISKDYYENSLLDIEFYLSTK